MKTVSVVITSAALKLCEHHVDIARTNTERGPPIGKLSFVSYLCFSLGSLLKGLYAYVSHVL